MSESINAVQYPSLSMPIYTQEEAEQQPWYRAEVEEKRARTAMQDLKKVVTESVKAMSEFGKTMLLSEEAMGGFEKAVRDCAKAVRDFHTAVYEHEADDPRTVGQQFENIEDFVAGGSETGNCEYTTEPYALPVSQMNGGTDIITPFGHPSNPAPSVGRSAASSHRLARGRYYRTNIRRTYTSTSDESGNAPLRQSLITPDTSHICIRP
ncbi:MAG: hypothetical protein M1835_001361 [Candelina submexicana]|nr:MAG: hypothetical protein M1835_001361 [Candelina submexicana]